MTSNFDVFGNLNNYLNQGEFDCFLCCSLHKFNFFHLLADEDSFKYDFNDTDDNDVSVDALNEAVESAAEKSDSGIIDLSGIEVVASRRSLRNHAAKQVTPPANECLDLTGSFDDSPTKKSRRSIAKTSKLDSIELTDEYETPNQSLSSIAISETSQNSSAIELSESGVRSRGRPRTRKAKAREAKIETPPLKSAKEQKLPKVKRMTYKQALALIKAPIPKTPDSDPAKDKSSPVAQAAPAQQHDVDLTGDILFSDKHSTAPLFQKQVSAKEAPVEEDDDFDFDKIRVKVKLMDVIKAYPLRRHQRFYDMFKVISEQNNIPVSNMFIFDGEKRIHPDDSPHSVSYKISSILSCRVMETKTEAFRQTVKEGQIKLKFQSDKWKKPIEVKTSKVDDFKTAIEILCEQLPFKPDQVTLRFDGDVVALSETPMDLDFEGGEILDCAIKV